MNDEGGNQLNKVKCFALALAEYPHIMRIDLAERTKTYLYYEVNHEDDEEEGEG